MRAARLGLVLLVLPVAAAVAWFVYQREAGARSRDARLLRRIAALESVEPRRGEPPTVFSRRSEPPKPPTPAASAGTTDEQLAPPEAAAEQRVPLINEELGAVYANDFESEPVDTSWAASAERSMGTEINAHLPKGSSVLEFECRSRFCRLDVVHDNTETANEMLMDLFFMQRKGPFSLTDQGFRQGDPVPTSDGKQRFTIYIARPGVPITMAE
jgi:hypothetical protein